MMLVRWQTLVKHAKHWAKQVVNSRGDHIIEEPHGKHRARYATNGRRDHVGDGRSDLDRQ